MALPFRVVFVADFCFYSGPFPRDSTIYNASLGPVLVRDTNPSGGIYRTTYGPEYFASINLLPNTTQVVFDLNFGNDSYPIALEEARAAIQHLGSKLEYFERQYISFPSLAVPR